MSLVEAYWKEKQEIAKGVKNQIYPAGKNVKFPSRRMPQHRYSKHGMGPIPSSQISGSERINVDTGGSNSSQSVSRTAI